MHINKSPNGRQTNFLNYKWQILLIATPEEITVQFHKDLQKLLSFTDSLNEEQSSL